MPRGKAKTTPEPAQPPTNDPQGTTKRRAGEKRGTRMRAVERALRRLGPDAKPVQIQEYLKTKGLDMDPSVISNYKGTILKRQAAAAGSQEEAEERPQAHSKPVPARGGSSAGGISVQDVRAVKDLAERVGAENLREMINLLAN